MQKGAKYTLENVLTVYLKNLHTNVYSRLICDTPRKSTETIKMSLNSCTCIQQDTGDLVAELASHVWLFATPSSVARQDYAMTKSSKVLMQAATWMDHTKAQCWLKSANLKRLQTSWFFQLHLATFHGLSSSTPVCVSRSVISDSLWPHQLQPGRLLCPWDSPGENTGVGCHFLLQGSSTSARMRSWAVTAADLQSTLKGVQGREQNEASMPWEKLAGQVFRQ